MTTLSGTETHAQGELQALLTENARTVLERRYLIKDENGVPRETPAEMFRRVAGNIAQGDAYYDKNADLKKTEEEFYGLMSRLKFLPNSPTLMNAGRGLQQLAACFVLAIDDNMESIFEAVKDTALVHKSGGGTRLPFSRLRPKDDIVSTTYGRSSGPVFFMQVFDSGTGAVNQGGFRRGANMGILKVTHPDIIEFITSKRDHTKLNNFNISVAASDDFMPAVINDEDYQLINPRTGEVVKTLRPRKVFELMVSEAWNGGEPGIIFIDRINEDNPTPQIGEIESTNPCGEQPLLPYEACTLGSINLSKVVKDGAVDFENLRTIVRSPVHFLDNVIDMSQYPIDKISHMVHANRKPSDVSFLSHGEAASPQGKLLSSCPEYAATARWAWVRTESSPAPTQWPERSRNTPTPPRNEETRCLTSRGELASYAADTSSRREAALSAASAATRIAPENLRGHDELCESNFW